MAPSPLLRVPRLPLLAAAMVTVMTAIYLALLYVPSAQYFKAPYAQRIFYFHVPSAWTAYLAFGVVFAAGLLYLKTREWHYDHLARASAEVGLVFCTVAIISGSLWGRAEWGTFWRFDDTKLTVTFVLWLVFVAYIFLRAGSRGDPREARMAAVYGTLGFIGVPLSFVSSRIWNSLHPNIIGDPQGSLSPVMGMTLGVSVLGFTLLYLYIVHFRLELMYAEIYVERMEESDG